MIPGRPHLPELLGAGSTVVALGIASAITWGAGDFAGGMTSRRAPLFGVVAGTQLIGMLAALALAFAFGETLPSAPDAMWAIGAGVCGIVGITSLYRGLAEGRMGVVAPTTGVIGASVPVVIGFLLEGVPQPASVAGIVTALVAVVLVTRAPSHAPDHPSGLRWALLAGAAIGGFNVCVGQISDTAGAFGLLVIIRLLQTLILAAFVVSWRQPWRLGRAAIPAVILIGLLDMTGNATFMLATQSGQLAIAAVLSSLYPVVTVVLAIAILRERVTRSHVAGIVLTGVGIALIALGSAAG